MIRGRFDFVETSPKSSAISFFFVENPVISWNCKALNVLTRHPMKRYFSKIDIDHRYIRFRAHLGHNKNLENSLGGLVNTLSAHHVYIYMWWDVKFTVIPKSSKLRHFPMVWGQISTHIGFYVKFWVKNDLAAWLRDVSTSSKRPQKVQQSHFFLLKIRSFLETAKRSAC